MAVYAVGDIQGCYKPLRKLLKKVDFNPLRDKLWCVGDLVNRGPDSLATLRFLMQLGDACVCVLGNHDLHLLELAAGGEAYRRDTLDEIIRASDADAIIDWLRKKPLMHVDEKRGWAMVHAGLHPKWSIADALARAQAIEAELRGEHWQEFCRQLHHVKFPIRQPKKEDPARLLFDAAVFTRTRYCTRNGYFNWDVRTGESTKKSDKPWYRHKQAAWKKDGLHIVYGHWAAKGLVTDQDMVLGLDSGCVWGGSLSLARLKKGGQWKQLTSVKCKACAPIGK